eukprot:jgi/Mesvir1/22754/Mv14153-RA.2
MGSFVPPQFLVLYASQTGNAQDVAEHVGREATRRLYNPVVLSIAAFDPVLLPEQSFVVFVVSTTGQGDPPDSIKSFWKFLLRKSLPKDSLSHLSYAIFGLGDSGYSKYNQMAKLLDRRLASLGGSAVVARGLGDDQDKSGYNTALDPWLDQLWATLRAQWPLPAGTVERGADYVAPPKYRICFHGRASGSLEDDPQGENPRAVRMVQRADLASFPPAFQQAVADGASDGGVYGPTRPFMAPLTRNECIASNASEDREVRHLEVDLTGSGIHYQPGDLLAIMPSQSNDAVMSVCRRLGYDPDAFVTVEAAVEPPKAGTQADGVGDGDGGSAQPVRLARLVAAVMDVTSASPRRYFFEVLGRYASVELEAERLRYFVSGEGLEELYKYNQKERRTVAEVLEDFPSSSMSLEWLLETAPRLQPRFFSISSSQAEFPHQAHVTAAIVRWKTPFKRARVGLCTGWLSRLGSVAAEDVKLPVWVAPGTLRMPASHATPIIMIGPGTGVAAFRAFSMERRAFVRQQKAGEQGRDEDNQVGASLLFFGCRHRDSDFLYADEWPQYAPHGVLSEENGGGFFVAFSRDQVSDMEFISCA